jgi:hypothetical protein
MPPATSAVQGAGVGEQAHGRAAMERHQVKQREVNILLEGDCARFSELFLSCAGI